jgi:hypothetical protein
MGETLATSIVEEVPNALVSKAVEIGKRSVQISLAKT